MLLIHSLDITILHFDSITITGSIVIILLIYVYVIQILKFVVVSVAPVGVVLITEDHCVNVIAVLSNVKISLSV